ncbi:MAG: DNA gyrase C-terminal beta-propeller domain-containing protein [Candidatus Bathyarchaeia archaeon]
MSPLEDTLLIASRRGRIMRLRAREISIKGRNTLGVMIMRPEDKDNGSVVRRIPPR